MNYVAVYIEPDPMKQEWDPFDPMPKREISDEMMEDIRNARPGSVISVPKDYDFSNVTMPPEYYSKNFGVNSSDRHRVEVDKRARRVASHKCPVIRRMKDVMATNDKPVDKNDAIDQLIKGLDWMPEADATVEILRIIRSIEDVPRDKATD